MEIGIRLIMYKNLPSLLKCMKNLNESLISSLEPVRLCKFFPDEAAFIAMILEHSEETNIDTVNAKHRPNPEKLFTKFVCQKVDTLTEHAVSVSK